MSNKQSLPRLAYVIDPSSITTHEQEDEISFLEIWQVLVKRRRIIYVALSICFLLASVLFLLKPPGFEVNATIQIGSLLKDDKGQSILIENPADVLEKIKSAYIPFVVTVFNQQKLSTPINYGIEASIPKGTNLILVKVNACKQADEEICTQLVEQVVQKIKDDHARTADLFKKNLEVKLASVENALKAAKDEIGFIAGKKHRLSQTADLLTKQIQQKQDLLNKTLVTRSKIVAHTAAGAMLALQVDNEIKKSQELIDNLEQRLTIGINQEHDDLNKAEKANSRLQNEQENLIGSIQAQILGINSTKAVAPVLMSAKPTGASALLVICAAVMAGLMMGIVAVFLSEFAEKAKIQALNKVSV